MAMTEASVSRFLDSYNRLSAGIDAVVADFYARLFERAPETRRLFKDDMTLQRQHLAATLALIARNVRYQDVLDEAVMELGAQHVTFGTSPAHYVVVRDTLLGAIGHALGEHWTPQLADDWRGLIDHIAATMLRGATEYSIRAAAEATRRLKPDSSPDGKLDA